MQKFLIIFLIVFYNIFCTNACDLNFSRYSNIINSKIIIDYFQKNNLKIKINSQDLQDKNIKKLYKSLRTYINEIYLRNFTFKDKILKIIIKFNENTQEFDFENYFEQKENYSDALYV